MIGNGQDPKEVPPLQFSVGWWNTGLSPKGKKRKDASEDNLRTATVLIIHMLMSNNLDFLAIGEVCESDVEYITSQIEIEGSVYKMLACFEKVGKGKFNQAYIYNSSSVAIDSRAVLSYSKLKNNYRAGHALNIRLSDGSSLIIAVSHWPSQLNGSSAVIKTHLAAKLRDYIAEQFGDCIEDGHFILMGDYNSEPYEDSLSQYLLTSRDKTKIKKEPRLFYNAYWNKLGMSDCNQYCGSHYYKSGMLSNWHLFDQIIFSSAYVAEKQWRLIDEGSILSNDALMALVVDSKTHFDHLPVIAKVEKNI